MIRLFGFLTGAGATIALMMLMIGPPELTHSNADVGDANVGDAQSDAAVSARDLSAATIEPALSDRMAETPPPLPARRASPDEIGPPVADQADPARQPDQAFPGQALPAEQTVVAAVISTPAGTLADTPANDASQWHSFWNPFRSEIAANGFASRLRSVTGIDYRVVRLEPGSYQVAFAYVDDAERRLKIAQIESATGLNLPEEARPGEVRPGEVR
ncbi:MAG: hypothetical protein ACR2QV_13500 [Gammaproteobacteria bacterium]